MAELPDNNLVIPTKDLHDMLICPLSKQFFYDPVIAGDGIIYEKQLIQSWLNDSDRSPFNSSTISKTLNPVPFIKQLVTKFLNDHPECKNDQYQYTIPNIKELLLTNKDFSFESLQHIKIISALDFMSIYDKYQSNTKFSIFFRNFECMKYVIDHIDDLNKQDVHEWSLVFCIAHLSTDQILNYILGKNVKVNFLNTYRASVLFYAMSNHRINSQTIRKLILDIDTQYINSNFSGPNLEQIISCFNNEFIDIDDRIDILLNYTDKYCIPTLLIKLLRQKIYSSVHKIIDKYPRECINNFSQIFQHYHEPTIKKLLSHMSTHKYTGNIDGIIQIMQSCENDIANDIIIELASHFRTDEFIMYYFEICTKRKLYIHICDMLVNYTQIIKNNWDTIIFSIFSSTDKSTIAKYLLFAIFHQMPLNCLNHSGENLLFTAVRNNNKELVYYLLKNTNCDIHCKTKRGDNLAYYSAIYSDLSTLDMFVNLGVEYNSIIKAAVEHNKIDIILYLIHRGCNINICDLLGNSSLHHAAQYSNIETIKFLIRHGADTDMVNSNGDKYYNLLRANKNIDYNTLITKYALG